MSQSNKLTIALLQLLVTHDVEANVQKAIEAIKHVKAENPQIKLVILPESFNAPYGIEYFAKYAEKVPEGPTCRALAETAMMLNIYIIGGSIIERASADKLYNTCTVWSPAGKLIARHRKIHLFTMNIETNFEGGVSFDESALLSPGNDITIVEIEQHKIGLGICHDKRFDELARIYRIKGCDMLVYPSAFCICQGPMHWKLLQRARASDNQLFVVTCAPGRDNMSGYVAYGHSMIVDPWGYVKREAGSGAEVIVHDIDFDIVAQVRQQIPIFSQRRTDIYNTSLIKN